MEPLGGAAAGGLLGSVIGKGKGRLAAVAVGTLAGAFLGRMAVKSMTSEDQQMAEANAQRSFEYQPSGATSSWNNPNSGHHGSVTPQAAYQNNQGQICRDFTSVVVIEGKEEKIRGTAWSSARWCLANHSREVYVKKESAGSSSDRCWFLARSAREPGVGPFDLIECGRCYSKLLLKSCIS